MKPVTIFLVVLCILITIYAWFSNTEYIFNEYGYSTENLFSGKFWILISSIFLHVNITHLISNIVVLIIFGFALEGVIGSRKFLLIFFGGAFFGDLLSSLIYPPTQISIGASAGIFAILAATMLIKPIEIELFLPIPLGIIAIGYLIYAIIGLITNYPPNVSHIAHIGGSLVGLFYGFYEKGIKSGLMIVIALFLLLLFVPLIWNFWVLLLKIITSLFNI